MHACGWSRLMSVSCGYMYGLAGPARIGGPVPVWRVDRQVDLGHVGGCINRPHAHCLYRQRCCFDATRRCHSSSNGCIDRPTQLAARTLTYTYTHSHSRTHISAECGRRSRHHQHPRGSHRCSVLGHRIRTGRRGGADARLCGRESVCAATTSSSRSRRSSCIATTCISASDHDTIAQLTSSVTCSSTGDLRDW